jgi:anaerobic selenocysteine-containing dehydrogenase
MKYIEYDWDLEPYGITFDPELDIDKLGWKHGDYFRITNVNGKAMMVKCDPLVKFIREGENGQISAMVG